MGKFKFDAEWFKQVYEYFKNNDRPQEWLMFGLFIVLGFVCMWILNRIIAKYLHQWLLPYGEELAVRVVKAVTNPLRIVIVAYFFLLGFDEFKSMPGHIWQRVHDIYPVLNGIIILVFLLRVVDIMAQVLRSRIACDATNMDERWADLAGILGKVVVVTIGGMVVLGMMGINIIPLITGAGFLGAALALASQSTLANAIGSLEIMFDRLFKEGDRISFGEYDGFVTKMGFRSIQLTALTGEKINLPNKDVVDKQIRNFSRNKLVRTSLAVGITYDSPRERIEHAMRILEEVVQQQEIVKEQRSVFRKFGDYTLDLEVIFWADYKTVGEYHKLMTDLHLAVKEKFDAVKIEFAFPTQTLHLKREVTATS